MRWRKRSPGVREGVPRFEFLSRGEGSDDDFAPEVAISLPRTFTPAGVRPFEAPFSTAFYKDVM